MSGKDDLAALELAVEGLAFLKRRRMLDGFGLRHLSRLRQQLEERRATAPACAATPATDCAAGRERGG